MFLPEFDYLKPKNLAEACSFLTEHRGKAKLLAGGTDLLVRMKQRLVTPSYVIGAAHLTELDYIHYAEAEGLSLGAFTPIDKLETSPLIRQKFPLLQQAASSVASPQIRHRATLAGNICQDTRCRYFNRSDSWRQTRGPCYKTGGQTCHEVKGSKRCYALFCSDLAIPLLALDARVKIRGAAGERDVPLAGLYSGEGDLPLKLQPEDMITGVQVPAPVPRHGAAYLKHSLREGMDFGLVTIAVSLSLGPRGTCRQANIVLGCVASGPFVLSRAATGLKGKRLSGDAARELGETVSKSPLPFAPVGASPSYKKRVLGVLLERALTKALAAATGRAH